MTRAAFIKLITEGFHKPDLSKKPLILRKRIIFLAYFLMACLFGLSLLMFGFSIIYNAHTISQHPQETVATVIFVEEGIGCRGKSAILGDIIGGTCANITMEYEIINGQKVVVTDYRTSYKTAKVHGEKIPIIYSLDDPYQHYTGAKERLWDMWPIGLFFMGIGLYPLSLGMMAIYKLIRYQRL